MLDEECTFGASIHHSSECGGPTPRSVPGDSCIYVTSFVKKRYFQCFLDYHSLQMILHCGGCRICKAHNEYYGNNLWPICNITWGGLSWYFTSTKAEWISDPVCVFVIWTPTLWVLAFMLQITTVRICRWEILLSISHGSKLRGFLIWWLWYNYYNFVIALPNVSKECLVHDSWISLCFL